VKNPSGCKIYLQESMTRLTPIIKGQLFLKLTKVDKNRLAAFHSYIDKESVCVLEKHTRMW